MDNQTEILLTLQETGDKLGGLNNQAVRRLIRNGLLVGVNIGKGAVPRYRVSQKDLAVFISEHRTHVVAS